MADLIFEVDDEVIARLEIIARGRGMMLEDYVRGLIHAEDDRGQALVGDDDLDAA